MNAVEAAQHIFGLMEKAGYPYMSPELDDTVFEGVPPTVQVWDADMSMIRLIAFADDEMEAGAALSYARDVIPAMENPEYYWPEAWWIAEGKWGKIEGWEEPHP